MPIGWFAKEYERTCNDCGYTWRVPRAMARKGVRGMTNSVAIGPPATTEPGLPHFNTDNLDSVVTARAETIEESRRCPKCGMDNFTQRPVKSRA